MAQSLSQCDRCNLSQFRTQVVFGVGNPEADLVFVGVGPDPEDDLRGEPFVGTAGRLLDKMMASISFRRQDVYLVNVVKCHTPNNRSPLPEEMVQCQSFLFAQLELIRPKVIFALGKVAVQSLTGYDGSLDSIRGKTLFWRGIPVIPSYHPGFYLRSPSRKRAAWEDLLRLEKVLASRGDPSGTTVPK
ncbi:MAG: uracil-DNA glycosylase [Magnetococcales bacterium]|nr:uracil-DNA glycosylase [Magnetococcales bacterium]